MGRNDSNSVRELYVLAQVVAAFFGGVTLLGAAWFAGGEASGEAGVLGFLFGLSSVIVASVKFQRLSLVKWRASAVAFGAIGTCAGLLLLTHDIVLGPEWNVVLLRAVHISAVVTIGVAALRYKSLVATKNERER